MKIGVKTAGPYCYPRALSGFTNRPRYQIRPDRPLNSILMAPHTENMSDR